MSPAFAAASRSRGVYPSAKPQAAIIASSRPGFKFRGRKSLGLQRVLDFVRLEGRLIRQVEANVAALHVGLNARLLYPR